MTRQEEIQRKLQRLRQLISRNSLKGILLRTQANFSWITAGGLNVVTIADTLGISSILITPDRAFFITSNIELPRMRDEESLEQLGFEPVVFDWYAGDELDSVARIAPPEEVGSDSPIPGYRLSAKGIRELRYALLPSEIERYLWLGEKASQAIETVLSEFAKPGMKESEVVGELSRLLWKDRIDSVCYQCAADERAYRFRHAIPTERTIERRFEGRAAGTTRAAIRQTPGLLGVCDSLIIHPSPRSVLKAGMTGIQTAMLEPSPLKGSNLRGWDQPGSERDRSSVSAPNLFSCVE